MYLISTVAKKTKSKNAEVRYFARKHNMPKIIIENKPVFIFDKTDYRLFLIYKNQYRSKPLCKAQLVFDFYNNVKVERKKNVIRPNVVKRENILVNKICALLKDAKDSGVDKNIIEKRFKLDKKELQGLLNKHSYLPIAEDDEIDNKLYWVG